MESVFDLVRHVYTLPSAEEVREAENTREERAEYLPIQQFRIEVIRESRDDGISLSCPADVDRHMRRHVDRLDREHLWILCLDGRNHVIGLNLVSMGTVDSAPFHPREVFKPAIVVGATSVILVHNHPSGDPKPSDADVRTTKRVKEASVLLEIKLLDHVILTDSSFFSFCDHLML